MDELESFLVENRNKKIHVIMPGGNHGDTLIHMGLAKKLNEVKADYSCVNLEEICHHRIGVGLKYLLNIAAFKIGLDRGLELFNIPKGTELILFDGGGYMNDLWYGTIFLKQVLKKHKIPIAVAPQSFWFKKTNFRDLFMEEECPVTLFCREKYSFNLLSKMSLPKNVQVCLSKDTALYLSRENLHEFVSPYTDRFDLICFRKDKESIISEATKLEIIEKAKEKANNLLVADIIKKGSLKEYVSTIANADRILTDRVHVAILAHIFGKDLTLFNTFYHKNKGIYEYSLKEDSKIKFIDL